MSHLRLKRQRQYIVTLRKRTVDLVRMQLMRLKNWTIHSSVNSFSSSWGRLELMIPLVGGKLLFTFVDNAYAKWSVSHIVQFWVKKTSTFLMITFKILDELGVLAVISRKLCLFRDFFRDVRQNDGGQQLGNLHTGSPNCIFDRRRLQNNIVFEPHVGTYCT